MVFIKVLCDDRFDSNLTYQIDDEEVVTSNGNPCEACPEYEACQGWKREFGTCNK